jgi:hypothetical protein
MGMGRGFYRVLGGRPEGREETSGKTRRRWEDNIKIGIDGANWIQLAQDRFQWRAL